MDGIIIVNKPSNYTSRDIVNIIGGIFKTKKVGHAGTLDPLATGVLVIGIGKGTKVLSALSLEEKEYIAKVKIGIKTDTYDITGNILNKRDDVVSKEEILKALKHYTKSYYQEVPIYSAVKVKGEKLYNYARNNKIIDLPKKEITVFDMRLIDYTDNDFTFYCKVSKGTYIRSLINDMGNYLNKLFTMSELTRVSQGVYKIEESYNLDDITLKSIIGLDKILDYQVVELSNDIEKKVINGNIVTYNYQKDYVLFMKGNCKIAIYQKSSINNQIMKVFLMY